MQATAVIGAQFGDEGKGLATDYFAFADGEDGIVVRFNGGAQAGHTVVAPDGRRHVFHHFGSGSFVGAATFLSRFFVSNPLLWNMERKDVPQTGLFVDPDSPLTTPYDMLVNQEIERSRSGGRHGSCGYGINETIERNSRGTHATFVRDIQDVSALRSKIQEIRSEYTLARFLELGGNPSDWFKSMLSSDALMENYIRIARQFITEAKVCEIAKIAHRPITFEGAQGLLLDEHHRFFPHVTRSKTGLHNVAILAGDIGLTDLRVIYMTRAYLTRHGAGPLSTEVPGLSYPDPTNVPNEFQGTLRFGRLDLDLFKESVINDLASVNDKGLSISPCVGISCLDQVGSHVIFKQERNLARERVEDLPFIVRSAVGADAMYGSYGPTRYHMQEIRRRRWKKCVSAAV